MLLEQLRIQAETHFNEKFTECVVTVPAYFTESQRQATQEACLVAGLKALEIVVEPIAAAIAYGFDTGFQREQNVLIFDFGGGTFDVSVIKVKQNDIEVLAHDGDFDLGGQDVN